MIIKLIKGCVVTLSYKLSYNAMIHTNICLQFILYLISFIIYCRLLHSFSFIPDNTNTYYQIRGGNTLDIFFF